LKKVQETAVKRVSGLKSDTYLERCKELNLDTLEKRRNDQDLALTYKIVNDARFKDTQVLELIGNRDRAGTRMASEP
jgi:hypothetical protein